MTRSHEPECRRPPRSRRWRLEKELGEVDVTRPRDLRLHPVDSRPIAWRSLSPLISARNESPWTPCMFMFPMPLTSPPQVRAPISPPRGRPSVRHRRCPAEISSVSPSTAVPTSPTRLSSPRTVTCCWSPTVTTALASAPITMRLSGPTLRVLGCLDARTDLVGGAAD